MPHHDFFSLTDTLKTEGNLSDDEFAFLLEKTLTDEEEQHLYTAADEVRRLTYGNEVYL